VNQQTAEPEVSFENDGHLFRLVCPSPADKRLRQVSDVGMKAAGLSVLPTCWTPPFFVVGTSAYRKWRSLISDGEVFLEELGSKVRDAAGTWQGIWDKGILLRSSAVGESLADRGENETLELPADFDAGRIALSIQSIYSKFASRHETGEIAVVVQARASVQALGHLSNEQRVSKTRNHWVWEVETAPDVPRRVNTQRNHPPSRESSLALDTPVERALVQRFRELGRWCALLNEGRAHMEWGATTGVLWIFQLDFEEDQPDFGCNPDELLRNTDRRSSGEPSRTSPLKEVDTTEITGWRKIDKIAEFTIDRDEPYPRLFWLTGDELLLALQGEGQLNDDLAAIAHGRAICRTDCHADGIPRLNLPRTESVSERAAIDFMSGTLDSLGLKGASPEEVCFILHKFIPATSAVWAVASPDNQIVRVDSLWGLPDGLQYLPHDTFEFDVKRQEISSERLRFKPKFLQETKDGSWKVINVARRYSRRRSLASTDVLEVANQTHRIAQRTGRPIQIMWFCGIPEELDIGRNVPWFSMPPERTSGRDRTLSPTLQRFTIRSLEDVASAAALQPAKYVLHLNPQDPDLFRSDDFLNAVADVAEERAFPIVITGSILSHAYYVLDKRGIAVVSADEPNRSRARQRRIFNKLVRNDVPAAISRHGERAALATIAKSESRPALVVKLLEEAHELLEARTPAEVTAELADLLEVVRSLSVATGADWTEVESHAEAKRASRGSFDQNVVLIETSWPAGNEPDSSSEPKAIKLADLGAIRSDEGGHNIPFAALLASGAARQVTLMDGSLLQISMDGQGVRLEERGSGRVVSGQLEFKL
jgi:predicted house-cleaning noncanonical NTP pyrophosphatase (MazG superfamily)